jgi:hypothetical protein
MAGGEQTREYYCHRWPGTVGKRREGRRQGTRVSHSCPVDYNLAHIQRTSLGIMSWACSSLSPRERGYDPMPLLRWPMGMTSEVVRLLRSWGRDQPPWSGDGAPGYSTGCAHTCHTLMTDFEALEKQS